MFKKVLSAIVLLIFIAVIYLFLTWPKNGDKVMQYLGGLGEVLEETFGDKSAIPDIRQKNKAADTNVMDAESDIATIESEAAPPVIEEPKQPEPPPKMPEPVKKTKKPLPELGESDAEVHNALKRIIKRKSAFTQLRLHSVITRFVVTVDNLTHRTLPNKYRLTKTPKGEFAVNEIGDQVYRMQETNYQRYINLVDLLDSMDTRQLVLLYQRYYPLFQEAYSEMGNGNRLFHNRLLEVIDHLLDFNYPHGAVDLTRPGVFYKYADKRLESMTAGEKILTRMGPKNAARVQAKLQRLERELVTMM